MTLFHDFIFQKDPIVVFLSLKITEISISKNISTANLKKLKSEKIQNNFGAAKKSMVLKWLMTRTFTASKVLEDANKRAEENDPN